MSPDELPDSKISQENTNHFQIWLSDKDLPRRIMSRDLTTSQVGSDGFQPFLSIYLERSN